MTVDYQGISSTDLCYVIHDTGFPLRGAARKDARRMSETNMLKGVLRVPTFHKGQVMSIKDTAKRL